NGASIDGYPDVDVRTTTTGYPPEKGGTSGWLLKRATSTTADAGPGGANLRTYATFDSAGRTTANWSIAATGTDARTTAFVYYTVGANSADAACGNRPEWAGKLCVTKVAGAVTGQRADMSADLTVTRVESYNRYGAAQSTVDTSGGHFRRTVKQFDPNGRGHQAVVTSDIGTTLPPVVTAYSSPTGPVESTTMGRAVTTRRYDPLRR